MKDRIDQIRARAARHRADGALLTFMPDIRWACGFTGSNALLLVLEDAVHFVTDGRYRVQAEQEVAEAEVHVPGYNLVEHVAGADLIPSGSRLVVQADHLTLAQLGVFEHKLRDASFIEVSDFLVEAVASKTEEEITRIQKAQQITDAVFQEILGVIRPGMSEREVAAEIVYRHLRRGAEKMSFETIVASGPQGALPHARPTEKKLQKGEMVVLDFGCVLDGYSSDMTRTVSLGDPGDEARRVYEVVRHAQQAALDAARSGMSSKALDREARKVIEHAGYGSRFAHGLGHGIGLQTHEWPRVSYHTDVVLPEGAVVTIEPGIYVEGEFGVRIEDIVVLGYDGCRNLTASTKELVVIGQ